MLVEQGPSVMGLFLSQMWPEMCKDSMLSATILQILH
jgi:hypothetical protein